MGICTCGRSPTGNCVGWHRLSEEDYEKKKKDYKKLQEEKNEKVVPSNNKNT